MRGRLRCSTCMKWKDKEEFPVRSDIPRGYKYYCKECGKTRNKEQYHQRGGDYWRKLYYNYGITRLDFEELLDAQAGTCAICYVVFDGEEKPCVDHDHNTGEVRGILCLNCNRGLGAFYDVPDRLRRAAEYLEIVEAI